MRYLNEAVEHMQSEVERNGGSVETLLGDGLIAYFPSADLRHAHRAVRAAMEISRAFACRQADFEALGRPLLPRLGIASDVVAEVWCGPETPFLGRYAAAKLARLGGQGSVMISRSTHDLVLADFELREFPTSTRGLPARFEAWEVVREY